MSFTQNLNALLQNNELANQLKKGAKNPDVKGLQTLLHEMGFDRELNWARFGADGDYGGSTTAALKAFAEKNGIISDGTTVSTELALKVMERYSLLGSLQQLYVAYHKNQLDEKFKLNETVSEGSKILVVLLRALGFKQENTTEALQAFGREAGITSDGSRLTNELAKAILDKLSPFYGDRWAAGLLYIPVSSGLQIDENSKSVSISEGEFAIHMKKFKKGLYTAGNQAIESYILNNKVKLKKLEISDSALNIIRAVSENEGKLDAINTWDGAFLSMGMFQWTIGVGNGSGELPALLKKIKEKFPDTFMEYFGQFGIDISSDTGTTYGYLSLNGKKINSRGLKTAFRLPAWAFRFWKAGQDENVKAIEIEHALSRLKNFYWKKSYAIKGFLLSQIITSEYGVGLILDNHVNRPAFIKPCIEKAMEQTLLDSPSYWTSQEEQKVIDTYLDIRKTYRWPKVGTMTDAHKRAKVTKKYLDNGIISNQRGSFKFAEDTSERSISGFGATDVPMPAGYREEDHPDIVRDEEIEE